MSEGNRKHRLMIRVAVFTPRVPFLIVAEGSRRPWRRLAISMFLRQGISPIIRVRLVRGIRWFIAPSGSNITSLLRVAVSVCPWSIVADFGIRHVDISIAISRVVFDGIVVGDISLRVPVGRRWGLGGRARKVSVDGILLEAKGRRRGNM